MYADDSNLTSHSNDINKLEELLNHQWLLSIKLTLNVDKTEYMIIRTHQRWLKFQKKSMFQLTEKQ